MNVTIVSIGNETDNGMSGGTGWAEKCALYSAGSRAVREVFPDALVAIHYSNPEHDYVKYAQYLTDYKVDYDIFGTSYYPYWHGTLENLTSVMKEIADITGKRVMVLETSWAYTLEDGDGNGNTVSHEENSDDPYYSFSVQGQADEISSVTQAIADVGDAALGCLYWEPAWIPVKYYNPTGRDAAKILESNKRHGRSTARAGHQVMHPHMIPKMRECITAEVQWTIRRCLILADMHWTLLIPSDT